MKDPLTNSLSNHAADAAFVRWRPAFIAYDGQSNLYAYDVWIRFARAAPRRPHGLVEYETVAFPRNPKTRKNPRNSPRFQKIKRVFSPIRFRLDGHSPRYRSTVPSSRTSMVRLPPWSNMSKASAMVAAVQVDVDDVSGHPGRFDDGAAATTAVLVAIVVVVAVAVAVVAGVADDMARPTSYTTAVRRMRVPVRGASLPPPPPSPPVVSIKRRVGGRVTAPRRPLAGNGNGRINY